MKDRRMFWAQNQGGGSADGRRQRARPHRGIVNVAPCEWRQPEVQVDLHRTAGPGDLVVVRVVEAGRSGPGLEAHAVERAESVPALVVRDEQIDVAGRPRARSFVKGVLVREALEYDRRDARGGERAHAFPGHAFEQHVAGDRHDAIPAKGTGEAGGERLVATD